MTDVDNKIKMIVEGLLLAAGKPLNLDVIAGVFSEDERPDRAELKQVLKSISDECDDRGFELIEVASGYRFQVKQDISEWIARLWEERPPRYSRALLETLALIAYRQPITRGDIEEIRGVAVSPSIIRTLIDREWVRIVGHKDVPGKPALFATTKLFLDYFNLKSIQELPPLSDIRDLIVNDEEFDLEDDLADRNIIELPDPDSDTETETDEAGVNFNPEELPEEEEAVELSRKPLDEILGITPEEDNENVDTSDDTAATTDEADDDDSTESGLNDDHEDAEQSPDEEKLSATGSSRH